MNENHPTAPAWHKVLFFLISLSAGTGIFLIAQKTMRSKLPRLPLIQAIQIPVRTFHPLNPVPSVTHSTRDRAAVEDFQHCMDSLKSDPLGKSLYDSINRNRPGLLDSARKANRFYHLYDLLN